MRRKNFHESSREKIQEKEKQSKRSSKSKDKKITPTTEKRMYSEPHRRILNQHMISEKTRRVKRSDEKKYHEVKLLFRVRKLQKQPGMMIPRLPFRRVVKEIVQEVSDTVYKWQPSALDALQYSAEDFMTNFFADSFACAEHAQRVTLMSKDLALARRIRGNRDPSNW